MRKIFIALLFVVALMVSSCHKSSTTGNLVLKFNPLFGSNFIVPYTTYTGPDGKFFNFQDFKVYLSHIKLIYTNGDSVEVEPLAYFSASDGYFLSVSVPAPVGSFKGIRFNIGLDSVQNAQQPSGDTSSPISSNNNTYWTPQNKFVFVEMDGTVDTVANSSNVFAYHVGTNPYYTSGPVLSKSFSINGGSQTVLTLNANVQNLFYGSGNTINISTDPITMTTGSAYYQSLAHTFINDFSQVFSIE